jgi:peptidase E
MQTSQHIVALGGGGFSLEASPVLDNYILGLARRDKPRICFVPTASGDSDNYIVRFYKRFTDGRSEPTHLELFRRTVNDISEFLVLQDVVYVGGGNSANMLAAWRIHGVDVAMRRALEGGTILAGVSAGSLCWFEWGVTDSFGPKLGRVEGLGILKGSNCPHYDGDPQRRPTYQALVGAGMPAGFANDDGAALHFMNGSLHRVVASRPNARAYRVELEHGVVRETPVVPDLLGA